MAEDGKVPVRESVGAALRFWRDNSRLIAIVAAIGAGVSTVLGVLGASVAVMGVVVLIASTFISAFIHAVLVVAALDGSAGVAQRASRDFGRVWAAMAVIAFFLLIVFVVLAIPGLIVLGVLLAPRYGEEIQAASGDQAASVALMERIMTESPEIFVGFTLFYGLIWLALTSRLYLAAPASVDNKRILTFETWSWTKGNMWRILGARLLLLAPAYILVSAVSYLLGAALGMDAADPMAIAAFARQNVAYYAIYGFVTGFINIGLYRGLEAGLSTYLYRGLKPQSLPPA